MQERGRNYRRRKKGKRLLGKEDPKPTPFNDTDSIRRSAKNFVDLRNQRISENKNKLSPRKKEIYLNKKSTISINVDQISSKSNSQKHNAYNNKINEIKSNNRRDTNKASSQYSSKKSVIKFNIGKIITPFSVHENPEFLSFALALSFAILLVLLSSVDSILTEGVFLLYLGILLYKKPKFPSRGIFIDISSAIIILYTLGAFLFKLPNFYPEWRVAAMANHEIDFGIFNSIVPLESLESWFILSGCVSLFYYMGNWKINPLGIRWLSVYFLFLVALVAVMTIQFGANPLRFFTSAHNLFTPIRDYSSNIAFLYFSSGILSLGLLNQFYKGQRLFAISGIIGITSSIIFLIQNHSYSIIVLLFVLSFSYIVNRFLNKSNSVSAYFISAAVLLIISIGINFYSLFILDRDFFMEEFWVLFSSRFIEIIEVGRSLFVEFSLMGYGISTAHIILPFLSDEILYQNPISLRPFNILSFLCDFGIIGFLFIVIIIRQWIYEYIHLKRSLLKAKALPFSLIILGILSWFVLYDISVGIGIIFCLLVFFDFTVRIKNNGLYVLNKSLIRFIGFFYICIGILWSVSSCFNLPTHSEIRYRLGFGSEIESEAITEAIFNQNIYITDEYITEKDPNTHFYKAIQDLRAQYPSKSILESISRYSFLNPNESALLEKSGYLFELRDIDIATGFWSDYFKNNPDAKLSEFKALLQHCYGNSLLMGKIFEIAKSTSKFSFHFLLALNKEEFVLFLDNIPELDFTNVDRNLRFRLMSRILELGLFNIFDSYKSKYANEIEDFFILDAMKEKEMANFGGAISIIRKSISKESISNIKENQNEKYIDRVFFEYYPDYHTGTVLLKRAIEENRYPDALNIINHLMKLEYPPLFVYYWKAEILYKMNNIVDCWFAYMAYIEKSKIRHFTNPS